MIASLNIVAKMFAKIAKTFIELLATIMATRRRPVLILHLEAKYGKMECKNEIYAKKLGKEHLDCKSQLWQKVNGQSQRSTLTSVGAWWMTSADDVANDVADDVT